MHFVAMKEVASALVWARARSQARRVHRPRRHRRSEDAGPDRGRRELGPRPGRNPGSPLPAPLPRHLDAARLRRRAHLADRPAAGRDQPAAAPAGGARQGGRLELGIGAGAFWEAVEAMGGPRRTPGESVEALEEAIAIIRGYWSGERSLTLEGRHYTVRGAKPGPPPAHPIGLWVGAYGPRMLRLTGRLADGWIPSLGSRPYMPAEDVPAMQAAIDESARRAGRDPQQIVRAVNVVHPEGVPGDWTEPLARIATELRFTTVLVGIEGEDPVGAIRRLGEDVAPRVRELVGRG